MAFRSLAREAHVLTRQPELLWQQMYNRLQWEGEEVKQVLAWELAKLNTSGSMPWLRLDTPTRESEALIRTLEGHADDVSACAFSPDGRFIVSASMMRHCGFGTLPLASRCVSWKVIPAV